MLAFVGDVPSRRFDANYLFAASSSVAPGRLNIGQDNPLFQQSTGTIASIAGPGFVCKLNHCLTKRFQEMGPIA